MENKYIVQSKLKTYGFHFQMSNCRKCGKPAISSLGNKNVTITFLDDARLKIGLIFQIHSSNLSFLLNFFMVCKHSILLHLLYHCKLNCFCKAYRILSRSSYLILVSLDWNYYHLILLLNSPVVRNIKKRVSVSQRKSIMFQILDRDL